MPQNMPGKLTVNLQVEGQEPFDGIMPEATALDLYKSVVGFGWHEPVLYPKSIPHPEGDQIANNADEEAAIVADAKAKAPLVDAVKVENVAHDKTE